MNRDQISAKCWLQQYRALVDAASATAEDYARAHSAANRITATFGDGGGSGPSQDRMQEAALEMIAHAESLSVEAARLTRMHRSRVEVVRKVSEKNVLWGEILSMIYLEGMSCQDALRTLSRDRGHRYERSAIYKLRDRALGKAWAVIVEEGLVDE